MPVIQKFDEDLAVGGVIENVLSGSAFEFAARNSVVSIGSVSDAQDTFITITIGSTTVLEESNMVVKSSFPVIPDEMYYQAAAAAGDRIVIRIRNASAAVRDIRTVVQVQPL